MSRTVPGGMFVTLEGGEGSGKSTQARRIGQWLRKEGYRILLTSEPGGTPIGRMLREVVMNPAHREIVPETELLLYIADRAQHVQTRILPELREGAIVVSDRYHDSSVAYQHYGRGVPMDILNFLFNNLAGGLQPHLTFVLDLPVEDAMKRVRHRADKDPASHSRFEEEELAFHKRVRNGFLEIVRTDPQRVKRVDGTGSPDQVFEQIRAHMGAGINRLVNGENG